ncbi:MAG: segregation/condensation protein A [Actinomycetota bacterium]|nr:segregation/condensation protein A [Actinomycetota bacterium]
MTDPQGSAGDGYHVRIEVFEGPFDLLLQLIARRRLDVSEVDLAEITTDFLAHLRLDSDDPALDLDGATRFLVVAATLIELKAARLLPAEERAELDDLLADARDVLYARLLEYRAFREASRQLADRLDANRGFAGRHVGLEPRFAGLVPEVELAIEPSALGALAAAALRSQDEDRVNVSHLRVAVVSLEEAAGRLLERLTAPGERTSFRTVVAGLSRPERVVHFLAILELFKLGHLELYQPTASGALTLERRAGGGDLSGLTDSAPEASNQPATEARST